MIELLLISWNVFNWYE